MFGIFITFDIYVNALTAAIKIYRSVSTTSKFTTYPTFAAHFNEYFKDMAADSLTDGLGSAKAMKIILFTWSKLFYNSNPNISPTTIEIALSLSNFLIYYNKNSAKTANESNIL